MKFEIGDIVKINKPEFVTHNSVGYVRYIVTEIGRFPQEKEYQVFLPRQYYGYRQSTWKESELILIRKTELDLNKIMPPVCTPNERAFLDEIKEKGKWDRRGVKPEWGGIELPDGYIPQSDFTKCNLSELVEGKG